MRAALVWVWVPQKTYCLRACLPLDARGRALPGVGEGFEFHYKSPLLVYMSERRSLPVKKAVQLRVSCSMSLIFLALGAKAWAPKAQRRAEM